MGLWNRSNEHSPITGRKAMQASAPIHCKTRERPHLLERRSVWILTSSSHPDGVIGFQASALMAPRDLVQGSLPGATFRRCLTVRVKTARPRNPATRIRPEAPHLQHYFIPFQAGDSNLLSNQWKLRSYVPYSDIRNHSRISRASRLI